MGKSFHHFLNYYLIYYLFYILNLYTPLPVREGPWESFLPSLLGGVGGRLLFDDLLYLAVAGALQLDALDITVNAAAAQVIIVHCTLYIVH